MSHWSARWDFNPRCEPYLTSLEDWCHRATRRRTHCSEVVTPLLYHPSRTSRLLLGARAADEDRTRRVHLGRVASRPVTSAALLSYILSLCLQSPDGLLLVLIGNVRPCGKLRLYRNNHSIHPLLVLWLQFIEPFTIATWTSLCYSIGLNDPKRPERIEKILRLGGPVVVFQIREIVCHRMSYLICSSTLSPPSLAGFTKHDNSILHAVYAPLSFGQRELQSIPIGAIVRVRCQVVACCHRNIHERLRKFDFYCFHDGHFSINSLISLSIFSSASGSFCCN